MEDEQDPSSQNETTRGRPRTTKYPSYFIPRRPRVVKMRDLSPSTRTRLTKEYYEVYDPWTGIRIAATLGILISLFTLFLIYKSKFHKSKSSILPSKKTSLYLYDEDGVDCDLGSLNSSENSGTYGYSFTYNNKNNAEERLSFPFQEGINLEEMFVKSSLVECIALKVHQSGKRASKGGIGVGPKFGTLRITEDASKSLPCSPYKPQQQTLPKSGENPSTPPGRHSLSGSIVTIGSTSDTSGSVRKSSGFFGGMLKPKSDPLKDVNLKKKHSSKSGKNDTGPKSLVVTAKKPQDYRSRSTVVAIARRKKPS